MSWGSTSIKLSGLTLACVAFIAKRFLLRQLLGSLSPSQANHSRVPRMFAKPVEGTRLMLVFPSLRSKDLL